MQRRIIGFIVMALGVLMISYTGVQYFTREKVLDIGKLHIQREQAHFISWPPVVGVILIVAGLLIVVYHNKRST